MGEKYLSILDGGGPGGGGGGAEDGSGASGERLDLTASRTNVSWGDILKTV